MWVWNLVTGNSYKILKRKWEETNCKTKCREKDINTICLYEIVSRGRFLWARIGFHKRRRISTSWVKWTRLCSIELGTQLCSYTIKSSTFWDIMPCNSVKVKRRFGEKYRLCLQGRIVHPAIDYHRKILRHIPNDRTLHSQHLKS
jgi:hypothetical protein